MPEVVSFRDQLYIVPDGEKVRPMRNSLGVKSRSVTWIRAPIEPVVVLIANTSLRLVPHRMPPGLKAGAKESVAGCPIRVVPPLGGFCQRTRLHVEMSPVVCQP